MNFSIFTNFFEKFRGINYGLQPVRCPRGGLSCARRAAGCAPVGPPVGPPMGAVFRLKILFFIFFYQLFRKIPWNYGMQPVRCPRGGLLCARRAAGCAPVGPPVGLPLGAVFLIF